MKMHPQKLGGQRGIGGHAFPNDVPHDVLGKGTSILVKVFTQLPSIANS